MRKIPWFSSPATFKRRIDVKRGTMSFDGSHKACNAKEHSGWVKILASDGAKNYKNQFVSGP